MRLWAGEGGSFSSLRPDWHWHVGRGHWHVDMCDEDIDMWTCVTRTTANQMAVHENKHTVMMAMLSARRGGLKGPSAGFYVLRAGLWWSRALHNLAEICWIFSVVKVKPEQVFSCSLKLCGECGAVVSQNWYNFQRSSHLIQKVGKKGTGTSSIIKTMTLRGTGLWRGQRSPSHDGDRCFIKKPIFY